VFLDDRCECGGIGGGTDGIVNGISCRHFCCGVKVMGGHERFEKEFSRFASVRMHCSASSSSLMDVPR